MNRIMEQEIRDNTLRDALENVYSRSIVEDLWSDRMTDMTASVVFDELSDLYTYKEPLKKLKLDDLAREQAVKVINGYGYLSCQSVYELLRLIPKSFRFHDIRNVFPPSVRERALQTPFQIRQVLRMLHRLPLLFTDLSALPFLTVPILKRHVAKVERQLNRIPMSEYSDRNPEFYIQELERLLDLLAKLQIRNQWGYGNATIFTWLLNHFATHFAGRSESWVLEQLTAIPDNVTLKIQNSLIEISRICDKAMIDSVFSPEDLGEGWEVLQSQYKNHKATQMLEDFIRQYGARSANRDFIHPRWEEKPGLVLELVKVLIKAPSNTHKTAGNKNVAARHDKAMRNLVATPFLMLLVKMAKIFLALREDLRFGLDKVFYRMRRLLIEIYSSSLFEDLQNTEEGIFFLKLNELRSVLKGEADMRHMLPMIESRKASYLTDRNTSPPHYVTHDARRTMELSQTSSEIDSFECTAASPGVAEGRARIIRDARDFNKLQEGEILIAYNTDPGWTPLFVSAAGVAVEMGGILNHCAIVAREYGVPAVVGLEGITKKIKDGQFVRVDGTNGTLSILGP